MNSITKKCVKCLQVKQIDQFYKSDCNKDGFRNSCKKCFDVQSNRYHDGNSEKITSYKKEYRLINLDKIKEKAREWYQKNKEKIKAISSKNYYDNYEKRQEYQAEYRKVRGKTSPEKSKQYKHNRRALVLGNGGKIKSKDWLDLCNKYGNKCLCCGRNDVRLTLDHVIPMKKGGSNTIENVQPLCKSCNSKKGIKIIDYRI